ncbi:hypothetical protein Tco_0242905 [Tanacetum coccineum]
MKDMGEDDVILGIRIKHGSNGIAISQSYYIEKVVKKFSYFDYTLASTHMDTNEKLMPNNGQAISQLEYSKVIGCLMYAMTCTRPDITFATGKVGKYTSNPGTQHWQAIQRAFLLGGGAISWVSKKQTCITDSTIESEFVTLAAAGKEAKCVATFEKAYSQMYNGNSKHLGVRHSMIRELIMNGVISIEFVRTSWTNRNTSRRFYGCPILSPTSVNSLRWYDPPMCQRSVQIIPGLLRSRNELEEMLATVEEKQRKLLKFLIINWTQREAQQANELSNLTKQRQLLVSVNYRRAIIEELEHFSGNLVAYKTREHLKRIHLVEVVELKKELLLQVPL